MGKKSKIQDLPQVLAKCHNEEEVKENFASAFEYKYDTHMRMDLYTTNILFEFKYDKKMHSLSQRAKVIAQMLYYVRELKYGRDSQPIPNTLCGIDKNEAFFVSTKDYKEIYTSDAKKYDWDRAASTPCPNIVKKVQEIEATVKTHVYSFLNPVDYQNFCDELHGHSQRQLSLFEFVSNDKKVIDEKNFDTIFSLWDELFGDYVRNGIKSSKYFAADIQKDKSFKIPDKNEVVFTLSDDKMVRKPIPMKDYDYFWQTYEKCDNPKTVRGIWQRLDRLTRDDFRRFTGEFYTPIPYATKAIDYIERVIGHNWWEKGYRLWDMAAGTGNLEYNLPEEALPRCYISTLLVDDANYCSRLYPTSTCFQYDYLNDDVNLLFKSDMNVDSLGVKTKMPQKLRDDLNNPDIKWIVFINPPFVTANISKKETDNSKDKVSMTAVRDLMTKEGMGETSRELFSQFLWRISKEFNNKTAILGMFSKTKYINANNDQKMRDIFFKYKYESGFVFNSKNFSGNRGKFPIGFLIWNLSKKIPLEDQTISLDIFDDIDNDSVYKIGKTIVPSKERNEFLSKWCPRYKNTHIMPPFSSATKIAKQNKDIRDRVADGFLCSLMSLGNDFQHQNYTALFSGPEASAGAFSVVPANFEKAMITHTVRRLPKANWLNDRDQWMQPNKELPEEFVSDCVVWSLFSGSNNTVSMKDVKYDGKTYQIVNELYPYLLDEVKNWRCSLSIIESSISSANKDRYAAVWLSQHKLSEEANELLNAGREVYKYFYEHSSEIPFVKYSISMWDIGWWQIRMPLLKLELAEKELLLVREKHSELGEKLLPQIEDYGFLSGIVEMFEED